MKPLVPAAIAAFLSGCAAPPPPPLAGPSPDDPNVRVAAARHAAVTSGTADHRPVAPKPWLERNQDVAPRAEGDQ